MLGTSELFLVGTAAVAAGMVNALAGGGTLITFPALLAAGVPAIGANITNTVALCPGYLGATFAQSKDLQGQSRRLRILLPAAAVGGIVGGWLLLHTSEKMFRGLVPFLILLSCALLASQDALRARLGRRAKHATLTDTSAMAPVALAAIYGGYFGAGLSVIVLAVLGVLLDDSLTRLNALKQAISFATNLAAAIFLVFSGQVEWSAALVMTAGALLGGTLGGHLAGFIQPALLRRIVVTIGLVIALIYLLGG